MLFPYLLCYNFFIIVAKSGLKGFSFRKMILHIKLSLLRILLKFKPDEIHLCSACFRISINLEDGWKTMELAEEQREVELCKQCVQKAVNDLDLDSDKSIIDKQFGDDLYVASDSDESISNKADRSLPKFSQNIKLRTDQPGNGRLSRLFKSKTQRECKYFILKQTESDAIISINQDRIEKVMDESVKLFYSNLETLINDDEKTFLSILATSKQVKAAFEEKNVSFHNLTCLVIKNFIENNIQN